MNSDDYIRIIIKRRWIILQAFLIVLGIVIIGTIIQPVEYRATSKIFVGPKRGGIEGLPYYGEVKDVPLSTQKQLLASPQNLLKIIKELKLVDEMGNPQPPSYLKQRISLTSKKDSPIFLIDVISENPREAMLVANKLSAIFIKQNWELAQEETVEARKFIHKQLEVLGKELSRAREPLKKSIMLEPYIHDYQIAYSSYQMFLKKLHELQLSEVARVSNMKVIEKASLPERPIQSKGAINVLFGAALGLFVGLTIAYLLEYFDYGISNVEEVKRILGVPVLAVIPQANLLAEALERTKGKWKEKKPAS
ncbi:MAG: hypothetical protein KKD35_04405 [Elusimicrobia bacterium]|nr:hypothetical protein [Elusimicrobiota bacterium]